MSDLNSVYVGLQSVKTAISIVKDLKGVDASLKDAEVKLKMVELLEALTDAKERLIGVREENLELAERVTQLEKLLNTKDSVVFRAGYYFLEEAAPGKPEGPFCSKCYLDNEKLILLEKLSDEFSVFGEFSCPKCKATFG